MDDNGELPSPALIVREAAFAANVAAADQLLDGRPKRIRPHVKTHRTPALALRQLTAAAAGLTCATVGEAEAMVDAGADDVFVANDGIHDEHAGDKHQQVLQGAPAAGPRRRTACDLQVHRAFTIEQRHAALVPVVHLAGRRRVRGKPRFSPGAASA